MSYPSTAFHRCIPTLALSKSGKVGLHPLSRLRLPRKRLYVVDYFLPHKRKNNIHLVYQGLLNIVKADCIAPHHLW